MISRSYPRVKRDTNLQFVKRVLAQAIGKVAEAIPKPQPQKIPVDVNLRGFECGGRSRNRTGVGGFAIHYFSFKKHKLSNN